VRSRRSGAAPAGRASAPAARLPAAPRTRSRPSSRAGGG